MQQGMEKTNDPDSDSHLDTDLMIHDKSIMKWFADGHKAVKAHHGQQHGLCAAHEVEEMKLAYAALSSPSLAFNLCQHQGLFQ